MNNNGLPNMRYDFSHLGKGRLRAYNRAVEELERQSDAHELSVEELAFVSAAGQVSSDPSQHGKIDGTHTV